MNDQYNKIIASRAGYTYPEMNHADDGDGADDAIRTSDENIADYQAQVASQRLRDLEIMSEAQATEKFSEEDANILRRKNAGR